MARITILDIAKHADVSFATVSRVMNRNPAVGEELRQRVEKSMAELGYKPNRAASRLRGGKSYTLALLVGPLTDFMELGARRPIPSYIADVITGVMQSCQLAGYHLLIEPLRIDTIQKGEAAVSAMLDDLSLDGIVLVSPLCDRVWLLDLLANLSLRCVRINPGRVHERTISIGVDNHKAGSDIAEYVLRQGHREIGYIGGPANHGAHGLRRDSFVQRIAAEEGAKLLEVPGNFLFEGGWNAARDLLGRSDRPSAIFASNDEMGAGVLAYAKSVDIDVPRELSIIGFGDLAVARQCWPSLTTVRQPTIEIARDAATELVRAAAYHDFAEGKVVNHPHRLIERGSFAPGPAKATPFA